MLNPPNPNRTDERLGEIYQKSLNVMRNIRAHALDGPTGKKSGPTFSMSQVATLVGRKPSAIREAEYAGRLPPQPRGANGRRQKYTLDDISQLRTLFGTHPWREPGDEPAIIAVSNFKGGVGKSTVAQHLAQYLAIRGYRVLLVDCDSQASTTMMFGYMPDLDLTEDDTLYGYFHNVEEGLQHLIRKTHFRGLDLIPSNLKLYNLEYEIAGYAAKHGSLGIIDTLSDALASVSEDYDIILLDPPPALGMVSMAVLQAANSMVIPLPPSMVDFASTASFIDMARNTMRQLENVGARSKPGYKWIKLLASRVDERSITHQFKEVMEDAYGDSLMTASIKASSAIGTANAHFKTVYELNKPLTSYATHTRCMESLDTAFGEIESTIVQTWKDAR